MVDERFEKMEQKMDYSSKSLIRYPGGKFRARKILENYIPKHTKTILSPFFGGGSFELYMTQKNIQIIAYDIFETLANFWTIVQQQPQELAAEIQNYYGKVDAKEFKALQNHLKTITTIDMIKTENALALAADFFVVNRCSFSGSTLSGGYSKESATTRFTQNSIDNVKNFYNPYLTFSYGDCFEILRNKEHQTNTDLLFLDPPYMLEEKKNKLYGISGNLHKGFDHILFKKLVEEYDKPFLLTYNNTDEIHELWKDYKIVEAQWAYGMNQSKKSSEIIITNFNR